MNNWFSLCITLQSAFFFIFLLIQKNKENNGVMAFFGINFLIFGLYFLSGIQVINFLYASASYFAFSFLACLVPISVFYAINSLTQKPMNRFVKLFWLLPFINLVYGLILKHVALDVLALNYYDNWYTDLATYYRPLFFVVVLLEIRSLDRYSET